MLGGSSAEGQWHLGDWWAGHTNGFWLLTRGDRVWQTDQAPPLSQAAHQRATQFTDAVDIVYDATVPWDMCFFKSLNRIQPEPWREGQGQRG
jgi:hypothetical protein